MRKRSRADWSSWFSPPVSMMAKVWIAADDESGWTEPFPKPDMRGMSKKQRRKRMQELREKERATRR